MDNKQYILDILNVIDDTISDFNFIQYDDNYHIVFERQGIKFGYKNESEGVKKIIQLIESLCATLHNGRTLIIDELDSSISTFALIKILNDFINHSDNKNGQLIVSSHNVLLFDVSFLHSQQIYMIEKNESLTTSINTYYYYDVRSEKKNAYIDYLKGAYEE